MLITLYNPRDRDPRAGKLGPTLIWINPLHVEALVEALEQGAVVNELITVVKIHVSSGGVFSTVGKLSDLREAMRQEIGCFFP